MTIKFKLLTDTAKIPEYATEQSAGMDLRADITESIVIHPGERILIPTGLAIQLESGYEAQVRPRSGLAIKHGITVLNTPGTIDADFTGEIKVILISLGTEGRDTFVIRPGDRIAQLVINKIERPVIEKVDILNETQRGEGGFGSTGSS